MIQIISNPYYLNIGIIIFCAIIFINNKNYQNGEKLFVIIATLSWVLLSGFRHVSIGSDTLKYYYKFNQTIFTNWDTLFRNFMNIIFFGSEDGKDPGYYLFLKVITLFTQNYQVFLVIIALIFTVPLGIWVYKNSRNPFISFLIYSTLFYSFFSITGTRQTIATSLVVLIGYKYVKERRLTPFLILVLVGFTIHKSALAFLPFYFLANKKITKKYMITVLAAFPLLLIFRVPILFFVGNVSGYEYGVYEGAGTRNFTLLLILVFIVAIWKSKRILTNNPQAIHFYNAIIIAVVTTPLTWVNPSTMRAVQYYSIFLMLLIPEIINSFKRDEKPLVYTVVIGLLLILFIINNPQFMFFWE